MIRREFISLLGGVAAWPLAARAQQTERMRRIGVLLPFAPDHPVGQARIAALLQELPRLGWIEGRSVRIDIRWSGANPENIRKHADELVASAPDIIFANAPPAVGPLLQATRTVSILFVAVPDPVGAGFVDSLARPGRNATGFTPYEFAIGAKWLELLKELAPRVTRAAVIRDPTIPTGTGQFGAIQSVAPSVGVEVSPVNVRDAGEMERAIAAFGRSANGGLIVTASGWAVRHRDLIMRRSAQAAGGLLRPLLRQRRRPDFLWARSRRPIPASGRLHRSHPQRRAARRPAGADADQVSDRPQPEDREGARPRGAANAPRPRRRGDRMRRRAFITSSRM
jgi:putative ABC transport system substrate-binding protein